MTVEELECSQRELDQMIEAVGHMPEKVISELRSGPWPEPECGVCRAFDYFYDEWGRMKMVSPFLLPYIERVLNFHDDCLRNQRKSYSPVTYRRCLAVYEAARL